jgi:hypothetical protein
MINRAWNIVGVAVRFAYALGLHVRNVNPSATVAKRESLVRTWWSLYSLERTLSIVTGRPSIIVDSCCSVPLPMPMTEEKILAQMEAAFQMRKSSLTSLISTPHTGASGPIDPPRTHVGLGTTDTNSGSFFTAAVQLSIITQSVLVSLYTTSTIIRSAAENQHEMARLGQRLDQWVLSLPEKLNFQDPVNDDNMLFSRERTLLEFQLCGARMLLGRPCLNAQRQTWRGEAEVAFARRMGSSCIEAAKTVIDFLPDELDVRFIYDQCPWWCVIHHLMQAISVLLLGLSYPASTSHDSIRSMTCVKKAIRWLQTMEDPTAKRAYRAAMRTFETVSRWYPVDAAGIYRMDSVHGREAHVQQCISQYIVTASGYTSCDPASSVPAFSVDEDMLSYHYPVMTYNGS